MAGAGAGACGPPEAKAERSTSSPAVSTSRSSRDVHTVLPEGPLPVPEPGRPSTSEVGVRRGGEVAGEAWVTSVLVGVGTGGGSGVKVGVGGTGVAVGGGGGVAVRVGVGEAGG